VASANLGTVLAGNRGHKQQSGFSGLREIRQVKKTIQFDLVTVSMLPLGHLSIPTMNRALLSRSDLCHKHP